MFNYDYEANNYIGTKINGVLIKSICNKIPKRLKVTCDCFCGKEFSTTFYKLKSGDTKSCGCLSKKVSREKGKKRQNYKDYDLIKGSVYNRIIMGAKQRNIHFNLSIEYINNLFKKQNGYCALSGIKIELPEHCRDTHCKASLDRIDSEKGYTEENVQWVHKDINHMKWHLKDKEFINYCKAVAEHNKGEICQS